MPEKKNTQKKPAGQPPRKVSPKLTAGGLLPTVCNPHPDPDWIRLDIQGPGVDSFSLTFHHPVGQTNLSRDVWSKSSPAGYSLLQSRKENPERSVILQARVRAKKERAVQDAGCTLNSEGQVLFPSGRNRTEILNTVRNNVEKKDRSADTLSNAILAVLDSEEDKAAENAYTFSMKSKILDKEMEQNIPDTYQTMGGELNNTPQVQLEWAKALPNTAVRDKLVERIVTATSDAAAAAPPVSAYHPPAGGMTYAASVTNADSIRMEAEIAALKLENATLKAQKAEALKALSSAKKRTSALTEENEHLRKEIEDGRENLERLEDLRVFDVEAEWYSESTSAKDDWFNLVDDLRDAFVESICDPDLIKIVRLNNHDDLPKPKMEDSEFDWDTGNVQLPLDLPTVSKSVKKNFFYELKLAEAEQSVSFKSERLIRARKKAFISYRYCNRSVSDDDAKLVIQSLEFAQLNTIKTNNDSVG